MLCSQVSLYMCNWCTPSRSTTAIGSYSIEIALCNQTGWVPSLQGVIRARQVPLSPLYCNQLVESSAGERQYAIWQLSIATNWLAPKLVRGDHGTGMASSATMFCTPV